MIIRTTLVLLLICGAALIMWNKFSNPRVIDSQVKRSVERVESNSETSKRQAIAQLQVLSKFINDSDVQSTMDESNNMVIEHPEHINCNQLPQEEQQNINDLYNEFASEHILDPFNVKEYLKEMDEKDLILEYEAGEKSAAYVLGLNLQWKSFNSTWHNPLLNDGNFDENVSLKTIDGKALSESRKWLWKAAISGVPIALYELGNTFYLERLHIQEQRNVKDEQVLEGDELNKLLLLNANEVAYKKLAEEVAPDLDYFFGTPIESEASKFEKIQLANKTELYQDIYDRWSADRIEVGEPNSVKFRIPKHIKQQLTDLQKHCK
jgi:hypothetical protein